MHVPFDTLEAAKELEAAGLLFEHARAIVKLRARTLCGVIATQRKQIVRLEAENLGLRRALVKAAG